MNFKNIKKRFSSSNKVNEPVVSAVKSEEESETEKPLQNFQQREGMSFPADTPEEYEVFKLESSTKFELQTLSVVVLGASGDLAKKKTYPALYDLFSHGYLPTTCVNIVGYARSEITDDAFRAKIKDYLPKDEEENVNEFLTLCSYFQGQYGSIESFSSLHTYLVDKEASEVFTNGVNRIFYFAIPPNVFIPSAKAIDVAARSKHGWNRIVVEKPFGHDLKSALQMSSDLTSIWHEDDIYRIDHYLGKEIVQNLLVFRFGNIFLEPIMNNQFVKSIRITFKEDFGTQGRGGYFDNYGIIRDIMQVREFVSEHPMVNLLTNYMLLYYHI